MDNPPFPGHWQPEGAANGLIDGWKWTVHAGDVIYATAARLEGPDGGQLLTIYFNMMAVGSFLEWLESCHPTARNDLALDWRRQMEGVAEDVQLEYRGQDGSFSPRLQVRLPNWMGFNADYWYQEVSRVFTTLSKVCDQLAGHTVPGATPQLIARGGSTVEVAVASHIHDVCPLMGSNHRRILTEYVMSQAGVAHIRQLEAQEGAGNQTPAAACGQKQ